MGTITPDDEAIKALTTAPEDGPIVMVNILKFKPNGGQEAYARYGAPVSKMVEALGGRIVYMGPVAQTVIGAGRWDAVALVEYPSRKAFLSMVTSPEYIKLHAHREEGLEDTILLATKPGQLKL